MNSGNKKIYIPFFIGAILSAVPVASTQADGNLLFEVASTLTQAAIGGTKTRADNNKRMNRSLS